MKRSSVVVATVGAAALVASLAAGVAWWPREEPGSDQQARVLAHVALTRAERALAEGDLAGSRAAAQEALALDDTFVGAIRVLAVVEQRAGHQDEACRLMRDYVGRAATPEPARARLLATACEQPSAP